RLERLQRIVSKLQMESGLCEEQLNQADTLLQSDIRLLNAGKAPQKAAEVERDLDKADAMIRLLFNDVQALKDGRHPQGEQMYRRVYRLHERLVAIRTEYNLRLKAAVLHCALRSHMLSRRRSSRRDPATPTASAWASWTCSTPSCWCDTGLGTGMRGCGVCGEVFWGGGAAYRGNEVWDEGVGHGSKCSGMEVQGMGKMFCDGGCSLLLSRAQNSSKSRLRHLESLHGFVSAATKELMWLDEKEEEEVNFDWSDGNPNMAAKKENYS
ncbi:hypothetical protein N309_09114, partial [Tinamus guttatus]